MTPLELLAAILVVLIIGYISTWYLFHPKDLPPGPPSLPFIGHLHWFLRNKQCHLMYTRLAKQYGDIYHLRMGRHYAIVLNSPELIREAFVKHADSFSGRPEYMNFIKASTKHKGIIWNINDWKGARTHALTSLRDLGLGKKSLEEKIKEEAVALRDELGKYEGKPIDQRDMITNAVSNVICSVVFGERFEYGNPEFMEAMEAMNCFMSSLGPTNIFDYLPKPAMIMLLMDSRIMKSKKSIAKIMELIFNKVEQHKQTLDPENIRDLVDRLLVDMENGTMQNDPDQTQKVIMDLFVAGTETTSTSLQWLILYLIYNPAVQTNVRKEIHEVIGTSRAPALSDRESLRYLEATLLEVLRLGNIASQALPHVSTCDVRLGDYVIPKGALVVANIHSVQTNSKYWQDVDAFNPDRWLDDENNIIRHNSFLPFSIGRRVCLGEQLARNELFLFTATLLQSFEFKMADPSNPPRLDGIQGITTGPLPYEIILSRA